MGKNNGAAQRRAKARQQARKSAAKSSSSDIAEKEPTSPPSAPGEEESVTDPPSTIEDTVIDAAPVALEEAASTEASHSNPPSIEATHEQDLQALRDQIQGLQTELEDTQRTLSESHQAFAEQIVELSSSHDHDKEAACAELRTQRDKAQEALTAAQERVASLEEQVQDLNQKITEHAAETSKHASAMADMQGKLAVRTLRDFSHIVGMDGQGSYTLDRDYRDNRQRAGIHRYRR